MAKIGLFWGSNTGNQEEAAGFLKEFMESEGAEFDEYNIADTEPSKMLEYKKLILDAQPGILASSKMIGTLFMINIKNLTLLEFRLPFLAAVTK